MKPTDDRVNILMVDDHPAKLLSYQVILSQLDENLISADSAKRALEHLLKTDVAVVLLDVSMPEMGGFELAEMIASHPRFHSTAIIFISAVHLTDVDRIKGYQHGAVDYISVPIIPELLRAKVRIFAELHRKKRQLETLNRELEKRVADRTEQLEQKASTLVMLNTELQRRNQELDAVMRTAPDIIFSSTGGAKREYISARFYEFTGAPPNMEGSMWLNYVHPDDRARIQVEWEGCEKSGAAYEAEYRLRRADGQYRWFRARAVSIRDEGGRIVKWYGTCSDVHDSKLWEQSMRDSAAVLETMVQERTTALRNLSTRLLTMQDDERRRIARNLHEGLGQELVAAKMALDSSQQVSPVKGVGEASEILDRAIQQIRSLSHLLHPPLLDDVGLISALRWYAEGLTKRSGIHTVVDVTPQPPEFPRLAVEVEIAIFRIVQEALTNVYRHSGASQAVVSLLCANGVVTVRIHDDGEGIDVPAAELIAGSGGVGIVGMMQRAADVGGDLRVNPGSPGTTVEALIPLRLPSDREVAAEAFATRGTSA